MTRIERWALARYARSANARGRLVYVDERGDVRDLGAYALEDLANVAWSYRVAYRAGTREERRRLARSREASIRFGRAVADARGPDLRA